MCLENWHVGFIHYSDMVTAIRLINDTLHRQLILEQFETLAVTSIETTAFIQSENIRINFPDPVKNLTSPITSREVAAFKNVVGRKPHKCSSTVRDSSKRDCMG